MQQKFFANLFKIITKTPKIIKIISLSFLAFIVIIYFADFIIGQIIHSRPEVRVPTIENLNLLEATQILKNKNLDLVIDSEIYSIKISSGIIIAQYPPADTLVREGKQIKIVLSKGGENIEIPNVINLPQRIAEITLKNSGAIIGEEEYFFSLSVPLGAIMEQSPLPDKLVQRGSIVNLKISKGESPFTIKLMPDLNNLSLEKAEELLITMGNNFEITYQETDNINEDEIILAQEPIKDSLLNDNYKIKIIVGKLKEIKKDSQ